MQFTKLFLGAAIAHTVASHTVFTTLFVNDVDQGDGVCIRMPKAANTATDPVRDLASNDMACGVDGEQGVARVCSISQASKLTFEFREWADASNPGAIDISHKGPCAVYMKSVDDATTDVGYGPGWFKIWDQGYDPINKQWCTEKLMANDGLLSVSVPSDLAPGYYLVRPELLALHEADKSPPDPQFYTGCAQVFLQSTGSSKPQNTVSIPGVVAAGDPSVVFNIYTPKFPYPMPGPAPFQSSSNDVNSFKAAVSQVSQTKGLVPANAVLENSNWYGIELDSYSDETGCWDASKKCWAQATTCYNTAPPTGSKNCPIWETKCSGIDSACNAGNFNGPPNKGTILTPKIAVQLAIPAAETVISGDGYTMTFTSDTDTVSLARPTVTSSTGLDFDITTVALSEPTGLTFDVTTVSVGTQVFPSYATGTTLATSVKSTSASEPTTLPVSKDATCGPDSSTTCLGSIFGSCCSKHGWCGSTSAYCGAKCQAAFGKCGSDGETTGNVKNPKIHALYGLRLRQAGGADVVSGNKEN